MDRVLDHEGANMKNIQQLQSELDDARKDLAYINAQNPHGETSFSLWESNRDETLYRIETLKSQLKEQAGG